MNRLNCLNYLCIFLNNATRVVIHQDHQLGLITTVKTRRDLFIATTLIILNVNHPLDIISGKMLWLHHYLIFQPLSHKANDSQRSEKAQP